MSDNQIILKTRDAVALSLAGGVCIGFGAFAIFQVFGQQRSKIEMNELSARRPPLKNLSRPAYGTVSFAMASPQRMMRTVSDDIDVTFDEEELQDLTSDDQVKILSAKTQRLQQQLLAARSQKYNVSNPNRLSASDIETIRSIFDAFDADQNGYVTHQQLIDLYNKLGEPLTQKEATEIIAELDPNKSDAIAFDTFLSWWHEQHKGGKQNKSYAQKFKFIAAGIGKSNFDVKKVVVKKVGPRNTTEFRFTFHYEQNNHKLKQISPWHDIPLHHGSHKAIYNFVCEIPKWSRAKWEITTGEAYNPIHQDVKNGKLRFYQHGDMMFNYGALPQTWENPKKSPKDTGCPGDNDPLDVIEFGTRQLKTGSITPVKVLGVLSLLDSGETDWKILAININDPLANLMHDVHDFEKHMPGAIHAIREYLRIYKVCTGASENKFAFRGEAMNSEYAHQVIEETHEEWKELHDQHIETV